MKATAAKTPGARGYVFTTSRSDRESLDCGLDVMLFAGGRDGWGHKMADEVLSVLQARGFHVAWAKRGMIQVCAVHQPDPRVG